VLAQGPVCFPYWCSVCAQLTAEHALDRAEWVQQGALAPITVHHLTVVHSQHGCRLPLFLENLETSIRLGYSKKVLKSSGESEKSGKVMDLTCRGQGGGIFPSSY